MKLVEFLGVSRAGKTSQIRNTEKRLTSQGYDVVTIHRPDVPFSDYPSLYDFHMSLAEHFSSQIAANTHRDHILLDRGFLDRQTLARFDFGRGALSEEQYAAILDATETGIQVTGNFFLFIVPEEVSLARLAEQARLGLDNSHLNGGLSVEEADELKALVPLYREIQNASGLTVVDGTNNFDQNSTLILRRMHRNGYQRSRSYR